MKASVFTIIAAAAILSLISSVTPHAGAQQVQGFVHPGADSNGYVWPEDTAVLHKLNQWRDLKFGVLIHFGLYSVPGIVESWSICSEDVDWIRRDSPLSYDRYKEWYRSLKDSLKGNRVTVRLPRGVPHEPIALKFRVND